LNTAEALQQHLKNQVQWREEFHGMKAVEIAKIHKVFADESNTWAINTSPIRKANNDILNKLHQWKQTLMKIEPDRTEGRMSGNLDISEVMDVEPMDDVGDVRATDASGCINSALEPVEPAKLLPDQKRAFDIVSWHLKETLAQKNPKQLLMIMPGEGGVGKSKTIQTMTEEFKRLGVENMLVKAAYTGIAASTIHGKTLHSIAKLHLSGKRMTAKTREDLRRWWADKQYLIIDEMSMVSKKLLAKLSKIVSEAKATQHHAIENLPFGGVNVILVGDFHQFPPVISSSSPLYWPTQEERDDEEEAFGGAIYEKFQTVVQLKQQVRVTDPVWNDLLQHVRYGKCRAEHIQLLRELIVSNPKCPKTNYNEEPWRDAVLITPRHGVLRHWNDASIKRECTLKKQRLYRSPAEDTTAGRPLSTQEVFLAGMSQSKKSKSRQEKAGLSDTVELFVGMKMMVTYNVQTDMDLANGARGEIVDIILDEREEDHNEEDAIVNLKYPPRMVLVKLLHCKAPKLDGLEESIVPMTPISKTFSFTTASTRGH
jgi:hypothetical protein